ncbi:MAG: class II aldolase/adducin family protein [Proteobacteria bacterium]|nr:class II aldolase/adducin family protein [Pseudomonadota bacterium]
MRAATAANISAPPQTETELRRDLAACYRIFDHLGWVELIYNHITVKVPGPDRHFLINPFGLMYREVTASNLVKIDLEGRIIGASRYPVNPAGFTAHSAIHEAIPEALCIMHTHTTAGMAVACKKSGLAMTNFYAAMLHGKVAYHDFEGITVNPDEKPRLVASLGNKRQLVLRNHGLLSWGETIPEAFMNLWTLNRACEIQLASSAMPGDDLQIPPEVCAQSEREALHTKPQYGAGRDVFDALCRIIDAKDPSYRN